MAYLAAVTENRQLEDLPHADFSRLLNRLPRSVRSVIKWEFCKLKIMSIVVFVIMIQRIFPSRTLAQTHCTIVNSIIFIH